MKNLIEFLKKQWIGRKRTGDPITAIPGAPQWTPQDYLKLAEEGYGQNVIVYRCVTLIARNLASVPWRLNRRGKILKSHPLLNLVQHPNPRQTGVSFLESLASYLLLSGNAYVELVMDETRGLQQYLLRPDRVKVIPEGEEPHYMYTVSGKSRLIQRQEGSALKPLLHLKMFHPLNDWYGMSPLEAVSRSVDQHNAVGSHNLALLQNGCRPTGALMIKGMRSYPPAEMEALRETMTQAFGGHAKAGTAMLLEGNMEWKEMGVSPKDMDFIPGKYLSAREIAQGFGVPTMLVGVPGDSTFANYKEARFHLWEDTILPLLDKIMWEINRWLEPLYEGACQFDYDVDRIPALIPRREALWDRMAACPFLSDEEKRAAVGYV